MLVIKIELWPFGDESRKKVLGLATIVNDGTGTHELGNYDCRILQKGGKGKAIRKGRVEGFSRITNGPWNLVLRALYKMLVDKKTSTKV